MNKLLKYIIIVVVFVFVISLLGACFIAGNTDIFLWSSEMRLLYVIISLVASALVIAACEQD